MDLKRAARLNGRRCRTFNIIDELSRETLYIAIDGSLHTAHVVRKPDQLIAWRGKPARLRKRHFLDLIASGMLEWAAYHSITLTRLRSGVPIQDGLMARFHKTCRGANAEILERPWCPLVTRAPVQGEACRSPLCSVNLNTVHQRP